MVKDSYFSALNANSISRRKKEKTKKMRFSLDDTICAIASPQGNSLRGIVRVSGNDALPILRSLFQSSSEIELSKTDARKVAMGRWRTFANRDSIVELCKNDADSNLDLPCHVLIWPDERSYTRQPSLEIHTLGSTPFFGIDDRINLPSRCPAGRTW